MRFTCTLRFANLVWQDHYIERETPEKSVSDAKCGVKSGRGDRIRTYDLRFPKPPRYQAALRPDPGVCLAPKSPVEKRKTYSQGQRAPLCLIAG